MAGEIASYSASALPMDATDQVTVRDQELLAQEADFENQLRQAGAAEQLDARPAARADPMISNAMQRLDHASQDLQIDMSNAATGFGTNAAAVHSPLAAGDPAAVPPPEPVAGSVSPNALSHDAFPEAFAHFERISRALFEVNLVFQSTQSFTSQADKLMKGN
jgi:hypothetical protein